MLHVQWTLISDTDMESSVAHCECVITLEGLICYLLGSNVATHRKILETKWDIGPFNQIFYSKYGCNVLLCFVTPKSKSLWQNQYVKGVKFFLSENGRVFPS